MVFFKFLDKTKPEQVKEAAKKAETAVEQANTPVVIKEEVVEPIKEELTVGGEGIITPELEIQADVADKNEEVIENTVPETVEEPSEVENKPAEETTEEIKEEVPEVNETATEQPETILVEDKVEEETSNDEDISNEEETQELYDDCHTESREKEVDGSRITLYELRNIIVEAVDYIFDRILTIVEQKYEVVENEEKD